MPVRNKHNTHRVEIERRDFKFGGGRLVQELPTALRDDISQKEWQSFRRSINVALQREKKVHRELHASARLPCMLVGVLSLVMSVWIVAGFLSHLADGDYIYMFAGLPVALLFLAAVASIFVWKYRKRLDKRLLAAMEHMFVLCEQASEEHRALVFAFVQDPTSSKVLDTSMFADVRQTDFRCAIEITIACDARGHIVPLS
ncbi:unnamed protein product, partial [Polarella glacialis]